MKSINVQLPEVIMKPETCVAGIWYWFPFSSRPAPHVVVTSTPPVKHTDRPVKVVFDVS